MTATGSRRALASRSGERGAALFIVVLVMVLLSAIGIFAARVSSLVQVASGYNRRATSAGYIADLATEVILAKQSDDPVSVKKCLTTPTNTCVESAPELANAAAGTLVPCCAFENVKIAAEVAFNNSALTTTPFGEIARPDLPATQSILPDTRIEITGDFQNPLPPTGAAISGSAVPTKVFQAEYTATGHLHPVTAAGVCGEDSVRASATSKVRAFVRYTVTGG